MTSLNCDSLEEPQQLTFMHTLATAMKDFRTRIGSSSLVTDGMISELVGCDSLRPRVRPNPVRAQWIFITILRLSASERHSGDCRCILLHTVSTNVDQYTPLLLR
jgi:hypothetical protein